MKTSLIYLFLLCPVFLFGQQKFDFESATVPSQWQGLAGSVLSIDNTHAKDGSKSLKCELTGGGSIRMELTTKTAANRVVSFPVYSEKISNDTLVFTFLNEYGTKTQEGRMLLNFKGWRNYHRHLYHDFGGKISSGYKILKITYFPEHTGDRNTIWLDNVYGDASYSGNFVQRIPGPHDLLDYRAGQFVGDYTDLSYLQAFIASVPPTAASASEVEKTDYDKVNQTFRYGEAFINSNSTAAKAKVWLSSAKCAEAKAYVRSLGLTYNIDGSIRGRGIEFPLPADTLLQHSFYVLALSYGAQTLQDSEAENLLIDFSKYLIDQGIAEGGPAYIADNNYDLSRQFFLGFLHALPVYREKDAALATEMENMLRYAYIFNGIYADFEPGLSTDYIHVKGKYLFAFADFRSTIDEKVRDVYAVKRLYENFTTPTDGNLDGIKSDGVGYHHDAMHNAYMYAFATWVTDMYQLDNTAFKITEEAYRNVCNFYISHYLQTAGDGTRSYFANAACGRAPFSLDAKMSKSNFYTLVMMGNKFDRNLYDDMGKSYNYFFFPTSSNVKNLNGFHQLNTASMGIYRQPNWVVNMRGLTSNLWGTEIYDGANVFGRYQSYGSLEVMYNGANTLTRSGYPSNGGWDWNVVPGTTTVHLDWKNLAPKSSRADEYQQKNFAGALSAGNTGIFAMDFLENAANYTQANKLQFQKSVFAVDSLLICLGSGIGSQNATNITATNLFQTVLSGASGNLYVNQQTAVGSTFSSVLPAGNASWIVNPAGTGYFIPSGNGEVNVSQGAQSTPLQSNKYNATTFTMVSSNAAKAYINHGYAPSGKTYHYVVAPNVSPAQMAELSGKLGNGNGIYSILSQQTNAHIIRLEKTKTTAYAVFTKFYSRTDGPLKDVLTPSLISCTENEDGSLTMYINSPDLNPQSTSYGWKAALIEHECVLNGEWKIVSSNQPDAYAGAQSGQTFMNVLLSEGKTVEIRLKKLSDTGIDTEKTEEIKVWAKEKALFVQSPAQNKFRDIVLYDISGRAMYHWQNIGISSIHQFDISSCPKGVYVVSVRTESGGVLKYKVVY